MDIIRIVDLLEQTRSSDAAIRERADKFLDGIQPFSELAFKLHDIIVNKELELHVRLAAVDYLKNNIANHSDLIEDNIALDLLGLTASPLPKELKVSLIDCCAVFARASNPTALSLWNKLELLLPATNKNMPTTSFADLADLEPRAQEYSVTISFINMLNCILESVAEYHMLQSHHFQIRPSLETCLNLVTNIVFVKVNSRQFNKFEEKWTILKLCINTYHILVSRYDANEHGNSLRCSFNLMAQILQDGEIFKCIMCNLEDAANILENDLISATSDKMDATSTYTANPLLDEYVSCALNLLNCVAEKQDEFVELAKSIPGYPTAVVVTLDVLLNGVNPRTGAVDRLATLVRVPAVGSDKSALQALKLLTKVVRDKSSLAEQVSLHLSSSNSPLVQGDNLVTLFVNCLSSDTRPVRIAALKYISACLDCRQCAGRPSHNIAHRLLGFDNQMTTLRECGSRGKVFDCLHSIINFFNDAEAFSHPELSDERTLGLEIIHKLCTDVRTFDLTLRFLRSSYDFLAKYLRNLFKLFAADEVLQVLETRVDETIWLMRLLAVEIKLACERSMKSIATNHLNLLLSERPRKLLEMLPNLMCEHSLPAMPSWECFDHDELWKIVSQRTDADGIIDLKDLHQKLSGEVKMINVHLRQVQKKNIRDEIAEILDYASNLNHSHRMRAKKCEYVTAWRELIETVIAVNALDCFDSDLVVRILFELTHELMSRTSLPNFMPNLHNQISSTIHMATWLLRQIGCKPTTTTNFLSIARSIQNLLEQTSTTQYKKARVNLYTAFLNTSKSLPTTVSRDLRFEQPLLDKIYRDALAGPEVLKVLALSILSQTDLSWVGDACKNGTLRHIVESLKENDAEIVATRGERITKAFFSFEAKVTLCTNIASTPDGAKSLVHLGIMEVLGSLRSIDSYLLLLDINTYFQKLYVGVLQLMSALSTNMRINNRNLLRVKPILHTEVLRNVPVLKSRAEGLETLLVTSSLQSQIILEAGEGLRHDFVNAIQHFTGDLDEMQLRILVNLLTGCVKMLRREQYSPSALFAPSWNAATIPVLMSQPSLGTLVSILNCLHNQQNRVVQDGEESGGGCNLSDIVAENCVYLIWVHVNIYLDSNHKSKPVRELESFKNETQIVLNDAFFNKLAFSRSEFVKIVTRKLKKLRLSIM